MPDPIVSILVVSYNTRGMTLDCLASIADQTRTPHEVIVIDNASTDGSAEAIAAAHPGVTLMAETANHGFAKANNIAARRARGRYILLLNPDTVVLDGAIDRLVAFAEATPQAGIWGGRTLNADRSLNPTNCFRRMSLWGLFCTATGLNAALRRWEWFNPETYGAWDRGRVREVDIVSGCFFLIPAALWRELGGFDLSFVMYGEEADLCLRARARGARPHVTPDAQIIHYVGASSTLRANRQVMLLRAKMTLIMRYFPGWQRGAGLALLRAWPWSRARGMALIARVTGRARLADQARAWAEVWARRGEWQGGYPALPHPDPADRVA